MKTVSVAFTISLYFFSHIYKMCIYYVLSTFRNTGHSRFEVKHATDFLLLTKKVIITSLTIQDLKYTLVLNFVAYFCYRMFALLINKTLK